MRKLFLTPLFLLTLTACGGPTTPGANPGENPTDQPSIAVGEPNPSGTTSDIAMDDFAKCVAAAGTKLYTVSTCPHCKDQKALFGESAQYLGYTECDTSEANQTACQAAGVEYVPMWFFPDGTKDARVFSLQEIAEKTKCTLPTAVVKATQPL